MKIYRSKIHLNLKKINAKNKQKNIDNAHEERFNYGLISIMGFFYTFVSYTSEHYIFFYSKIDICFQHIYFKTNINNYVGKFHCDVCSTFKILNSIIILVKRE